MSPLDWVKELRFRAFYFLVSKSVPGLVSRGSGCAWTIDPRGLGPDSRVLCAGAGHDISFEKALIETHRCRVVLADPSPTGIATAAREALPEDRLRFFPIGLADRDGELSFSAPHDEAEGSYRGSEADDDATVRFPCQRLSTFMDRLGWSDLDLLKMDIEGCEYGVLAEIVSREIKVRQICVEFHHGPNFDRPRSATARAILELRRAGFDLVHRIHWDHTFLRRSG